MTNKTYWFPDDKAWMAERKKQWRQIKFNLDVLSHHVTEFKRAYHKYHKELFLYGTLNPECQSDSMRDLNADGFVATGHKPFIYRLPIFKIWYHPQPDSIDLKQLLSEYLGYADLSKTRLDFFHKFCTGTYPSKHMYSAEHGMMNGREVLCIDFLFPGHDFNEMIIDQFGKEHPASMSPGMIRQFCENDTSCELYMDARFCPYAPGQYLWDHLSSSLELYPEEVFYNKRDKAPSDQYRNKFLTILAEVLSFEQRGDLSRHRPSTIAMVDRLITQYETKVFSDVMLKLWEEAKINIKKLKKEKAIIFGFEPEVLSKMLGSTFPLDLQKERITQWKQV